jgi:hypothetical protein
MGIREKDWILLSSYLDGELDKRAEDQLKQRIAEDPQFKAALDQLMNTKSVLKATPGLKVPWNFTLTPEMVGVKRKQTAVFGYRLATAVMSIMLVMTLVLDFGRFLLGGAMAPAAPKMEEVMLESSAEEAAEPAISAVEAEAHQDRAEADALEEAPVQGWALEAEGELQVEPQAEAPPPAEMEGGEEALGIVTDSVEEEKAVPGEETDEAANMAKEVGEPPATVYALPTGTSAPQPTSEVEPSQTPEIQPTIEYFSPEEDLYKMPWYAGLPVFKILEVLFGLGVVGFGAAAWVKRRRG